MTAAGRTDDVRLRLAPQTRRLIEEIKADGGFQSDGEVIRAALALQHHVSRRWAEGRRLFLGDAEGRIDREMTMAARP